MSFDQNWENLYSMQKRGNKYPYGQLVSVFFKSLRFLSTNVSARKDTKVLELGSGAGNNLWFISEQGYDTYGIDGSASACSYAKKQCLSRNMDVTIKCATFDELPFDNESIDIIIDREATYCGKKSDIKRWWAEANRVLKKGGLIMSFKFSDNNPTLLKIKNSEWKAEKIEENTYSNIEKGTFANTGIAHFSTYDEILEIFDFCDIKFINRQNSTTLYSSCDIEYDTDEFIVVGVKT